MELRATYTMSGGPDKTILLSAELHDKNKLKPIVVYLKDITDRHFQIGKIAKEKVLNYLEILDTAKIDIKCIIELNSYVTSN